MTKTETKLKVKFRNPKLLEQAMTHRSYLNESTTPGIKHNERLEFLGDAVLELIVTEYLFEKYPEKPEGDLTSIRSAIVKTTSLAETALKLDVGAEIRMSHGEEATGGRTRPYILANTFEAILGALYRDQGYEACRNMVERVLLPKVPEIIEKNLNVDNKSKLQEVVQAKFSITPIYELVSEKGPDHNKKFIMAVKVGKNIFGEGEGHSKQEAEQDAADSALKNWAGLVKKYSRFY